ncbi:MAG: PEP-CTERM sorting domain-containing protein [Sphingomonas sp.]|nr:PEP-CTERM sorting domain-containing protein [Sphingomonas sp.]
MNSFTGTLGSSFTANSLMGSAQNVTISSYYSASNALYGGTLLQSKNFTTGPSTFVGTNALALTGPFSETTLYTLNFGAGNGTFNSTAQLTAVPEPATWGMMIMGFGLMGAALRSRKTKVAFA